MKPLRVTCTLMTPVVTSRAGINLGGLLAFGAFAMLDEQARAELPPIGGPDPIDFDLPVKKWGCEAQPKDRHEQLWGWCTSDVIADWSGRQKAEVRRPAPVNDMRRLTDASSVDVSKGIHKPLNKAYEALWPRDGLLTWYCIGDADGVARHLANVTNIGKLHNHGHGLIERDLAGVPVWHIEEDEDAESGWMRRPIPVAMRGGGHAVLAPIRPPAWHRARLAYCTRWEQPKV